MQSTSLITKLAADCFIKYINLFPVTLILKNLYIANIYVTGFEKSHLPRTIVNL